MSLHGHTAEDVRLATEQFRATNRFGQPTDAALAPLLQRIVQQRAEAARVAVRPPTLPESWPSLPASPAPDLGAPVDEAERDRLARLAVTRESERDALSAEVLALDVETVAVADYAEATARLAAAQHLASEARRRSDDYAARLEAQERAKVAAFEAECAELERLRRNVDDAHGFLAYTQGVATNLNTLDYGARNEAKARLPEVQQHVEDAKAAVAEYRRTHPEAAAHVDAVKADQQRNVREEMKNVPDISQTGEASADEAEVFKNFQPLALTLEEGRRILQENADRQPAVPERSREEKMRDLTAPRS